MIVTCENCKVNKGEEEDMTYKFVPILLCDDCSTCIYDMMFCAFQLSSFLAF